jgi:hypothetical protein
MKKKSKLRKTKTPKKISAILIDYASDYINIGKDINSRQNLLNSACTAWNISILPESTRNGALDQFMSEFLAQNPHVSDENISGIRHDMELLIQKKISMFPTVKKSIMGAKIIEKDGKETILVASLRQ